jgi:hypothetical protein
MKENQVDHSGRISDQHSQTFLPQVCGSNDLGLLAVSSK